MGEFEGGSAADLLVKQGLRCRAEGDRAAALAAFEAAAAIDPARLGLRIELACELRALGRLDEAEAMLESVLSSAPNNVGALVEQAHVKRRRGDRAGALAGFEAASRAAPENVPIRLEIVRNLRTLNRLDEAEARLKGLAAMDPGNVGAAIERGHIGRLKGDRAAAAAAFAAAVTADPANGHLKLELARELSALKRFEDAEVVLLAIVRANPDMVLAHVERAELARRRGDRAGALKALEVAIAASPAGSAAELRLHLAAELRQQGAYEAARQAVEAVLAERGEHFGALMQLGEIHRALGEHAEALAAFERAANDETRRAEALVEVAREGWRLGAPRAASEALDEALAREPRRLGALLLAAEQALVAGRPDKALSVARLAIEAHPSALAATLVGARAAAECEPAEALSLLDRAEAAFGASPEIAATRIHVLRLQRDNDAAGKAVATAEPMIATHAGLWAEATSYAIANGDFGKAVCWLDARPDNLPRTRAREFALRGQMAQAQRDHQAASDHYRAAIADGGEEVEWLEGLAECCLLLADVERAKSALAASIKADAARRKARGRSANFSQHHLAQVMEEFLLDPPALEDMRGIVKLPAEGQIEPLKALVRRNPDNTSPALLLLNAMRRAGRFDDPISSAGGQSAPADPVPRRIVQYWHQKAPPEDVARLMTTWRDTNPDFEHLVLSDASAEERLKAYGAGEALRAFRNTHEIARKADILRLAVLTFEGGLFVDADDKCLKPLAAYVPPGASFVSYQERLGGVGSNFIGAAKNHPAILRALAWACEAVNRGDRDMAWLATGAGLLTRAFALEIIGNNSALLPRTVVLDLNSLNTMIGMFQFADYKVAALRA